MAARQKPAHHDKVAERRRRVAEMRLSHMTLDEIAREIGVAKSTVSVDLKHVREEWAERRASTYEEWAAEEIAKLDRLERTLLPRAIAGEYAAVDKIISLMDRRARMLGLDKPQLHEHTIITMDAIEAEISRLEAQLADDDGERTPA